MKIDKQQKCYYLVLLGFFAFFVGAYFGTAIAGVLAGVLISFGLVKLYYLKKQKNRQGTNGKYWRGFR